MASTQNSNKNSNNGNRIFSGSFNTPVKSSESYFDSSITSATSSASSFTQSMQKAELEMNLLGSNVSELRKKERVRQHSLLKSDTYNTSKKVKQEPFGKKISNFKTQSLTQWITDNKRKGMIREFDESDDDIDDDLVTPIISIKKEKDPTVSKCMIREFDESEDEMVTPTISIKKEKDSSVTKFPFCSKKITVIDLTDEKEDVCKYCDKHIHDCPNELFGMYCHKVVERYFCNDRLMAHKEKAKILFIEAYNYAMNFHEFKQTGTITRYTSKYPEECIEKKMMKQSMDWFQHHWDSYHVPSDTRNDGTPKKFFY